jgi:O-antigen/teichoic acid export membrane protein
MLIKHSILYVTAKIVPGMLGMATTAILTHLLDPAHYGLYGLALVVMTFGSTMVFDWLGISFMRFYQSRRDDPRVISTFVQMFLMLVGLTGVLTLVGWVGGLFSGAEASIYAIGVVMMWTFSWFELVARFEVANFRPTRYLIMNLGRGLFSLAGAAGAAWLTRDPMWTAAGMACGTVAGAFLCGFRSWRFRFSSFDPPLARAVLAFGLPMAASMSMSSMINSGTRWLIEILGSAEALGFYTAGFMLVQNTLVVAATGIASAGYSLAVRAVESGDPEVARRQLLANGTLLMAVLAPAALGMALTAHGLAATLVGPKYVAAVAELTPWMAAGSFFQSFRANYLDHAFQLGKRPSLQIWVTALAAVIAVGLCWVLIPREGPLGAAIAIAIAMAVSCVHAWISGRYGYRLPFPVGETLRIFAACAAMAVVVILIPGADAGAFLLQVAFGGIAYASTAVALDLMGSRSRVSVLITRILHRRLAKPV